MGQPIFFEHTIPDIFHGKRIDWVATQLLSQYSRALVQRWIKEAALTINGATVKPKNKVLAGDMLALKVTHEASSALIPEDMPLSIIFEDDSILIVNKPAGLVVHPAAGNYSGTLVNGLLAYHPELIHLPRAGLIHRLDKETSGLLVVSKTLESHFNLINQMQARTIKRQYIAIVCGDLLQAGTINAPIGRHPYLRTKMAVTTQGKIAITHYNIKRKFKLYTQLTIYLETGRTHQIRVHFNHKGYPLLGDPTYGGHPQKISPTLPPVLSEAISQFKRQALHAESLSFVHPKNNECMTWTCAPPDDLRQLIDCFNHYS